MSVSKDRGHVKWFNVTKGYGFISPVNGGNDVFVHITDVKGSGLDELRDGETIAYELTQNRGKTKAVNLERVA